MHTDTPLPDLAAELGIAGDTLRQWLKSRRKKTGRFPLHLAAAPAIVLGMEATMADETTAKTIEVPMNGDRWQALEQIRAERESRAGHFVPRYAVAADALDAGLKLVAKREKVGRAA